MGFGGGVRPPPHPLERQFVPRPVLQSGSTDQWCIYGFGTVRSSLSSPVSPPPPCARFIIMFQPQRSCGVPRRRKEGAETEPLWAPGSQGSPLLPLRTFSPPPNLPPDAAGEHRAGHGAAAAPGHPLDPHLPPGGNLAMAKRPPSPTPRPPPTRALLPPPSPPARATDLNGSLIPAIAKRYGIDTFVGPGPLRPRTGGGGADPPATIQPRGRCPRWDSWRGRRGGGVGASQLEPVHSCLLFVARKKTLLTNQIKPHGHPAKWRQCPTTVCGPAPCQKV